MLWDADEKRQQESQLFAFLKYLKEALGLFFQDYRDLHHWSIREKEAFWKAFMAFSQIKYQGELSPVYQEEDFLNYSWFPKCSLSFAENLLSRESTHPEQCALHFVHEGGWERKLTYRELKSQVSDFYFYLEGLGVQEGDRVAAFLPNIPEAVIAMLASSNLGAIFTSTSCDFGEEAVLGRFRQVKPKVLVATPYYFYKGKKKDLKPALIKIMEGIPEIESLVLIDYLALGVAPQVHPKNTYWHEISGTKKVMPWRSFSFDHPLYILYSSGTTGDPKCIVHSAGGTLLQHVKEQRLHVDLRPGERFFYFTTCGWMMWNWLVSGLATGAQVLLYEGSPAHPTLRSFIEKLKVLDPHIWGTSPRFLQALEKTVVLERQDFAANSLRSVLSTGAPLYPQQFAYVYEYVKKDLHLASISGGTDIISCFVLGNPWQPVYAGKIQGPGLGMDVVSYNAEGKVVQGDEGELVCRQIFPSMPLGFWGDENQSKFKETYFERFPGVWHHGDFMTVDENAMIEMKGRSDATLNPSGVRIGSAELYDVLEDDPAVNDSLCIFCDDASGGKIIAFLVLKARESWCSDIEQRLKKSLREKKSPRHVPHFFFPVSTIPYTRSGKKLELLVQKIFKGQKVEGDKALENPQVLQEYRLLFQKYQN